MDIEELQKEFKAIDFAVTKEEIKRFIEKGHTIQEFKKNHVDPYDSFWIRLVMDGEISWYTAEVEIEKAREFYKRNEV